MNDSLIPELPGFDDPLGVLRACHDRMLAYCDMLEKLVSHIAEQGLDSEAKGAIRKIAHYFNTSADQHHQDEEENLFPILNGQSLKLADLVFRLRKEHEELNRLWDRLAADLNKPSTLADNPDFAMHVSEFCQHYRDHIELENSELLFMAQHILSSRQLEEMGADMAKRRGIRK